MRRYMSTGLVLVSLLIAVPAFAQGAGQETLGERVMEKIGSSADVRAATVRADIPVLGSAEPVSEVVVTATDASSNEPSILTQDLASGFLAAGGVLLSAILILLLVILVATSRHPRAEDE